MKDDQLNSLRRAAAGVCLLTSAFFLPAGSAVSAEPAFPTRPIRFVVPFPPGTTTDVVARLVSLRVADRLGQPIVARLSDRAVYGELAVQGLSIFDVEGQSVRPVRDEWRPLLETIEETG